MFTPERVNCPASRIVQFVDFRTVIYVNDRFVLSIVVNIAKV